LTPAALAAASCALTVAPSELIDNHVSAPAKASAGSPSLKVSRSRRPLYRALRERSIFLASAVVPLPEEYASIPLKSPWSCRLWKMPRLS
jgi:hypothetical protein